MANEITITSSLRVAKGSLSYQSQPQGFNADLNTARGPTPGGITAVTTGTDVDLSALTTPGVCRIQNLDDANPVEVGIVDPETSVFYPMLELLAGESYVVRLSRNLAEEFGTGAGTGTIGPGTNRLRVRALVADCEVLIEAFESA